MSNTVEKVAGDRRDERWRTAVNTDAFRAIESRFHNQEEYDFAGYDVLEYGEEGRNDYTVVFRFDDGSDGTMLEASLTFRGEVLVETRISRDVVEDNEIVRSEVYGIENGEVVRRDTVE